jgi:uncharacterized protein YcbX
MMVPEVAVDALGIFGDRRFLVVDPAGTFKSQRSVAKMAQVTAHLDKADLILSAERIAPLKIPIAPQPDAPLMSVKIWSDEGLQAEDCGSESSRWLSQVLGIEVSLVRIGPAFRRPVKPAKARDGDVFAFADAYPFMVTTEASLADLNARLEARGEPPVPMNRFRPSFVVAGAEAFEEDHWTYLTLGAIRFRAAGACGRCIVTTIDQTTGERFREPLRTLAGFRRDPNEPSSVTFGQNLLHETKIGILRVGDAVTLE